MTALLNYLKPDRHYHNITHIGWMLDGMKHFSDIAMETGSWETLKYAILYHDVIYIPGAWDNEFQSAVVAADEILENVNLQFEQGFDVNEVQRLIMLTKDHKPGAPDYLGKIICDLDLAGLGGSWELYVSNRVKIRRACQSADTVQWTEGRIKFLSSYLNRDRIYHTGYGKKNWEAKARENMHRELDSLMLSFY